MYLTPRLISKVVYQFTFPTSNVSKLQLLHILIKHSVLSVDVKKHLIIVLNGISLVTNAYFLCAYSYIFFCEFVQVFLLIFAVEDNVGFDLLEFIIYSG